MAKVFNYVILISGLLLLMSFAGFPTASHWMLESFGITTTSDNGQITDVGFGNWVVAAAVVAIALIFTLSMGTSGSLQIGTFVVNTTDSRLVAGFASLLFLSGMADLISLLMIAFTMEVWVKAVASLFLFPIIVGYGIAMAQWWRGADI